MTLEEYWTEIVADIGNIETHGDAIAAISEKIKTEDTDIGALMSERDALVAERDELRGSMIPPSQKSKTAGLIFPTAEVSQK